jgi:hypothetical protein
VPLQPAGKVKLEQDDMDLAGRQSGCPDQLVNVDGAWAQRAGDQFALACPDVGKRLGCALFIRGDERGSDSLKRPA